jgi:hypothetical protein
MAEMNPNPTTRVPEEEERKAEGEHVVFYNSTRHEHELCLFECMSAYTCNGCNEYGANIGYKCKLHESSFCKNFALHEACATLPDIFQHPFRRLFKFRPKTHLRHHCDACRDVLRGYVFQRPDHLRLHPLCMVLPEKLQYGGHAHHQLKLVKGDLKRDAYACSACVKNIKSGRWIYMCEEITCNFCMDLSCAKIDFYGFSDSGIARVAPISGNRRRFMSEPSSFGKWVAACFLQGTMKGNMEAVLGEII